jgi:hypothetical protein
MNENPNLVHTDNALDFISDDGGHTYNKCHCAFLSRLPYVLLMAQRPEL